MGWWSWGGGGLRQVTGVQIISILFPPKKINSATHDMEFCINNKYCFLPPTCGLGTTSWMAILAAITIKDYTVMYLCWSLLS